MESEGPKLGSSTSDPVLDPVDPVEAADEAADADEAVGGVGVVEVVGGGVGEVVEE